MNPFCVARLVEFFRKIKKWLEMARLPPVYLEKVEALERKFEVISVIFNKYNTEYSMLFVPRDTAQRPTSAGSGRPRSRKPNKYRKPVYCLWSCIHTLIVIFIIIKCVEFIVYKHSTV